MFHSFEVWNDSHPSDILFIIVIVFLVAVACKRIIL
jgi:hypothetical protein